MTAGRAGTKTTRSWRDSPTVRVLGAFLSWALFTTSFTLLYMSSLAVLALGGSCASGGPYEIEVECPAGVALFTPLSIFGGIAAVAIGLLLSGGFGAPVAGWAWPVLFVGLSIPFFLSGGGGIVIGVVFAVMGGLPLIGLLSRGFGSYMFIGSRDVRGRRFATPAVGARNETRQDDAAPPRLTDWALSLALTTAGIVSGLLAAQWLWTAAG